MIEPWRYCANCDKQYCYHVDEKCPFEASNFKLRKGIYTFTEPGIGIVNTIAVRKIDFFEVSHVNTPADPSK